MLLAANVGNSIVSFGIFKDEGELIASFDISSDIKRTSDEYLFLTKNILDSKGISCDFIQGAILSSVVPVLTPKVSAVLADIVGKEPLIVGPGVKTGFHIKIDNPSELGSDMVANTAAVLKLKNQNKAAITVDLGRINTVSAISKNGEYLGCVIFPGLQLSFDALHEGTALLPNVNQTFYSKAIGKSSQSAVSSGVILGSALSVDGFVAKFTREMKISADETELFATGEYAEIILSNCKNSFVYEKDLTLRGLYHIYRNNL